MRLGTLRRRLQHDSIIGDINWISIEVGRGKRYTADERIQNFLQQTALPPARVLRSSSSVGPMLSVNLHSSSDTQVDVGGSPTTRPPPPAGRGCGRYWRGRCGLLCTAAAAMQRIRLQPQQQQQMLRLAGTPAAAAAWCF